MNAVRIHVPGWPIPPPRSKVEEVGKAVLNHRGSSWEQIITPRSRGDGQASGGNPAPSFYSHKMGTATANGVVSAPLAQCPVPRTWAITATSSSLLPSQVIWKKTHTYKAQNPPWHNLMDPHPWRGWEPGGGEVGRKERGGLCDQNVSSSSHWIRSEPLPGHSGNCSISLLPPSAKITQSDSRPGLLNQKTCAEASQESSGGATLTFNTFKETIFKTLPFTYTLVLHLGWDACRGSV